MSTQEALSKVMSHLSEDRLRELLQFAEFLSFKQENAAWQEAGRASFARCYGSEEPDYGEVPVDRQS